jgi:hypothetical protein
MPYHGRMSQSDDTASASPSIPGARRGWGAGVKEVGAALQSGVAPVANRLDAAVDRGVSSVGRALEDPGGGLASEVLKQADLPELSADTPLASLGVRLDREADLWRGVAMRQLARASWMERISVSSTVIALVAVLILAAIAAFRALLTGGTGATGGGVALLLCVGALLATAGCYLLSRVAWRIRHGQIEVAREALTRADLCELRLHRLAILLEVRVTDVDGYRASLKQLESELRAG